MYSVIIVFTEPLLNHLKSYSEVPSMPFGAFQTRVTNILLNGICLSGLDRCFCSYCEARDKVISRGCELRVASVFDHFCKSCSYGLDFIMTLMGE